ncbi:MAG: NAD-dependent epimerase/dehydratase family protein [Sulfurovum sp.]|nr:NAD-dependent epimerase/dehydratase family protein [Sulfurovum sp.]
MKKILLTGASGFVGSYFQTHYHQLFKIETFSFLKDDFEVLDIYGVDVIVHLSALVHQMDAKADEEAYERVNVTQTLQLAQKAKESGVGHFIFMSTVKVYGEESENIYDEDTACYPLDDYGKSKLKAEIALQKIEEDTFNVSIIRTPIVYGYGVKANMYNLIKLIQKVPILPLGGIHNRRSMVYIGNLCAIIIAIIESEKSGIFLAKDDETLSTSDLIREITLALDKKMFLVSFPLFVFLLQKFKPSFYQRLYLSLEVENSKSKKVLDFSTRYSVKEGIKLMIHGEK